MVLLVDVVVLVARMWLVLLVAGVVLVARMWLVLLVAGATRGCGWCCL